MFGIGMVHAQSTNYVYDANGHAVAVTASNGTSVQYGYNTLGHTSQISAPLGFDVNAANDAVSFNGAVAAVLSATATQLVTTVPSGASTGPISVTVAGRTAASAQLFAVDDSGASPIITQVNLLITSPGAAVMLTGAHLDPVSGYTAVQVGGSDALSLSSITDTQIQFSATTSGYITVETPYGEATSTSPLFVMPSTTNRRSILSMNSRVAIRREY